MASNQRMQHARPLSNPEVRIFSESDLRPHRKVGGNGFPCRVSARISSSLRTAANNGSRGRWCSTGIQHAGLQKPAPSRLESSNLSRTYQGDSKSFLPFRGRCRLGGGVITGLSWSWPLPLWSQNPSAASHDPIERPVRRTKRCRCAESRYFLDDRRNAGVRPATLTSALNSDPRPYRAVRCEGDRATSSPGRVSDSTIAAGDTAGVRDPPVAAPFLFKGSAMWSGPSHLST